MQRKEDFFYGNVVFRDQVNDKHLLLTFSAFSFFSAKIEKREEREREKKEKTKRKNGKEKKERKRKEKERKNERSKAKSFANPAYTCFLFLSSFHPFPLSKSLTRAP